jgi:hypothetical protein
VWVLDLDSFFRLGAPETFPGLELSERPGSMMPSIMPLSAKVGPDGTLWALDGGTRDGQAATYDGTLRSFDGQTWTDRAERVHAFDITADGTVWAAWGDGVVGRLGTDGFVLGDLGVRGPAAPDDFAVTDVGAIWLHDPATDVLIRQQGDYTSSSEGLTAHVGPLHKGPHGSLWVYQEASLPTVRGNTVQQDTHVPYFVRFDPSDPEVESPRTVYTQEDGVPILPDVHAIEGFLGVAPDESLWLTGYDEDGQPFGGLRRWDGSSTMTYLEGGGVVARDNGPDGTVWVRATEGLGGSLRTYAIPGSAGGPP